MGRNVIKAKLDIIFKKLFTTDNSVLTAFVGDLLDLPQGSIQKLEVLNPTVVPSYVDGKQGQLDLKMQVDDKIVNVEIQLQNQGNFRDRAMFYWSKIFSDELKKGNDYVELKKTISINILNFNLFECEESCSTFSLLENTRHELLSDKCSIIFFELRKVNKKIDTNNRKQLWLQLINAETEEELDMINEAGVPEIQQAVVILHQMSADEEMQEMARLREKWILDENSARSYAKREGIQEGIEIGRAEGEAKGRAEGRAEGRADIIEKLRKSGMSEEEINKQLNS